jgi:TPR repeat protein
MPVSAPESSQVASAQDKAMPVSAPESSQVASAQDEALIVSTPHATSTRDGGTTLRPDDEEITMLVNRGADSMKNGDLASARLLLRRAAEAGSARAALMLGTTFDPLFIQQLGAIGIVPDVARARRWYEKAAELGSDVASQRLDKLAHSGQ